jgi:predicted XRE-type DNA-binding protein
VTELSTVYFAPVIYFAPPEMSIIKTIDKKGLSVRKAQRLTGIDAGDFSRIRNADFRRMSVERLMTIINRLGSRIEVAVKVKRSSAAQHAAMVR